LIINYNCKAPRKCGWVGWWEVGEAAVPLLGSRGFWRLGLRRYSNAVA